jgi:hypothetical protein
MNDDIVEEVQRARQGYGEQFGFDLEAIGRDLREQERRSGRTIVNYLAVRAESSEVGPSDDEPASAPALANVRGS